MKRRKFLQTAGLVTGGMLLPVGWNSWIVKGVAVPNNRKRLVVIFLRGGIDGLNVVVPHQEANYYEARPTLAIPYPGEKAGVLDLDGFFGLHPALADLMPLWKKGSLAFIHCCGSPDETRSHFDAQDYLESGTPGVKKTADGWMNRLLATLPQDRPTQALNVGNTTPRILRGSMPVANLSPGKNSISFLHTDKPHISHVFDPLYDGSDEVSKAYQQGRQAREIILAQLKAEMMSASRGAPPANYFVDDAVEVAKLMVGDARTQLAFMAIGDWDTHIDQKVHLNQSLQSLGKGLATLVHELGSIYSDTVIMLMSEFGRTVKENGNGGTDHGRGNVFWLLGGGIRGGKVYGEWTGLAESQLERGRDLSVTTDFREAIAFVLTQHLQISTADLRQILPGYQPLGNFNLLG
ncbi:DUF1501 domain-containing protein [Pleurocapsales cyanobacterium LEGE 06147]|nr:DUF1501 domain-containing protein [Pleurocapsales cyanobacterium LEGE 06147]